MRTVVVGVEGRPDGEPALDLAIGEALRRRLPLLAVHAFALPLYGDFPTALFPRQVAERRARAEREVGAALDRALDRVTGGRTLSSSVLVLEGDVVPCLVSVAGSAALLVVGARAQGHLGRALHGSVAAGCLHHSLTPVVVVPHTTVSVPDRWLRSRVVVGLDGSAPSATALAWAVEQAREWASPLIPVVVRDGRGRAPAGLRGRDDLTAPVRQLVVEAGGADLEVRPRFLAGDLVERLLSVAGEHDLLVLGSRGRRTTSTSAALRATCTVVVVHEGQARREIHQRRSQPVVL